MTHSRIPRPRRCIGIADDLHKRLRQRALDEDASIADVVERALVRYLAQRDEANPSWLPPNQISPHYYRQNPLDQDDERCQACGHNLRAIQHFRLQRDEANNNGGTEK